MAQPNRSYRRLELANLRRRPIPLRIQIPRVLVIAAMLVGLAAVSQGQPPIIQPGAPGEPSREISAEDASNLTAIDYTDGDIRFMQGMISHHAQALEMTRLLESRTDNAMMRQLSERIDISQRDEIMMMQGWLRERDQTVPEVDTYHQAGFVRMPGMLTGEEMEELEAASGVTFDRLFLRLMIKHHRGAITMVDNLLDQAGAAQDPQLYAFTSDVSSDQDMEINRMDSMLADPSTDARVQLAAGVDDAGEAIWNMALITSRGKPAGFYEQTNAESGEVVEDGSDDEARRGLLNFANTDMAFASDLLFQGNYHGFNTYRVEVPASPQLVSSVVCPGGQGDVSVVGNLLIMSVEQTRARLDCGLQGVADSVSPERFMGLRIFDISDMRLPRQVAAVQTCRGSHTHTLVGDPTGEGIVYVYGSGTAPVRSADELAGCSDESPAENPDTSLFRIDVIEIPLANPEEARVVSRPFVFQDPESGDVAGLWRGGDHGPGTQSTSPTTRCHDITAYPEIGLAAGACSGNGILFDISDPLNPARLDEVVDPGFAYWHSATFNNDGTKVIFTDEWGGGSRARCRASDPRQWGANAIYDVVDGRLEYRSHYKLPAPQSETENCVAHNGSLVPVPGRDIMVQAWYQGGISVFDFTDSVNPFEIAYFDRGPFDTEEIAMAGYWSAYWYRGFIYGTEIARGLDILELLPSEFLTENEIGAASVVAPATFNAQDQRRTEWPARPVIARAYLDQLGPSNALDAQQLADLSALLARVDGAFAGAAEGGLAGDLTSVGEEMRREADAVGGRGGDRLEALGEILTRLADAVR